LCKNQRRIAIAPEPARLFRAFIAGGSNKRMADRGRNS
jgi:hypothetical protein